MLALGLLIVFLLLIFISVPIGISLGIVSVLPGVLDANFPFSAEYIIRSMFGGMDSFPLLAVPMFVLSGIIMARGGVSKKLFDTFSYFLADKTAGLPCAAIVTCLFYGAISGSAPATVAAVGSMTIPVLLKMGYEKEFATAIIAVAGGLGVIIPPSIPFILFGMATGTSVSDLFVAGILPGILIAVLLMAYVYYYCRKHGEDKEKISLEIKELKEKGFLRVLKESFWALLTPVIILGCIYTGIASPTEAAVLSVFYALFISIFVYKTLKFSELKAIFVEAIRTVAPILFILAAAVAFSRVITVLQIPQMAAEWINSNFNSLLPVIILVCIMLLIVGMFMDTSPAILILAPIFTPILVGLGMNPVHFGMIMIVNLSVGFVTPPIGINLFVASSLTDIPALKIAKKAVPLIIVLLIAMVIIIAFPEISLALLG